MRMKRAACQGRSVRGGKKETGSENGTNTAKRGRSALCRFWKGTPPSAREQERSITVVDAQDWFYPASTRRTTASQADLMTTPSRVQAPVVVAIRPGPPAPPEAGGR